MATTESDSDDFKADMTPMIDVVFLMIIFFVCIDFKTLESKLEAWLPTDRGSARARVAPLEQLSVQVHVVEAGTPVYGTYDANTGRPRRYALDGHRVRWLVGPKPCADFAAAKAELERIARDPHSQIPDPVTGGRKLMACVLEGQPGTRYDDIARTADLCAAAGFGDIHFGGGLGAR